jgi:hypothetical protein
MRHQKTPDLAPAAVLSANATDEAEALVAGAVAAAGAQAEAAAATWGDGNYTGGVLPLLARESAQHMDPPAASEPCWGASL